MAKQSVLSGDVAGLLAYNPAHMPDTGFIVNLWILLSAYFCLSVFHVKYRIKEITAKPLVGYILIAVAIILFTVGFSVASLLVSTLIVFKTVPLFAAPEAYHALKIKHIGEILHIINSFQPGSLYQRMEQRGYSHWTESNGTDWHIWFYKS